MSWKGFTKAISRMPQVVMQKAGYAEETIDDDFERLEGEFREFEQSCKQMAEETRSYMVGVQGLMSAQKNIASTLLLLHHVGSAKQSSSSKASSSSSSSSNEGGGDSEISEIEVPIGVGPLAQCIGDYKKASEQWNSTAGVYVVQTLQGIVVDPAAAILIIAKQVRSMIDKRGRKLIDYDKEKTNLKKAREKAESGPADVSKVTKAEYSFEQVRQEYEGLNERLKYEIPILMKMRSEFMDPFIEAIISFQIYFFEQGMQSLQPLGEHIDFSLPIADTYLEKRPEAVSSLRTLSLIPPRKIDPSADVSERNEYGTPTGENPPSYNETNVDSHKSTPPISSNNNNSNSNNNSNNTVVCMAVSLYPYRSDTQGDLNFEQDQKIQILQKTENQDDWWLGKIGDQQGYFPANYVRIME